MIKLEGLSKKYNKEKIVFKTIDIELGNTGLIAFVGLSGVGKTTLFNMISGLDNDYDGSITYNGQDIRTFDFYNNVSYLMQDDNLFDNYTVLDNLLVYENIDVDEINKLLKKLDIENLKNKKVSKISGGERRRVSIAKALLKSPNILICDEPTSSLDNDNAISVMMLLKELSKNILVIYSSHDSNLVDEYSDSIFTISDFKIKNIKNNLLPKSIKQTNNVFTISYSYKIKSILRLLLDSFSISSRLIIGLIFLILILSLSIINYDVSHVQTDIMKSENDFTIVDRVNNGNCSIYENDSGLLNLFTNVEIKEYYYIPSFELCFYNYKEYDNKFDYIGSLPTNKNDIMIYQITAEQIMHFGVRDADNNLLKINKIEDLLDSDINVGDSTFRISGIVRQDLDKYKKLKKDIYWLNGDKTYSNLEKLFSDNVLIYSGIVLTNKATISELNNLYVISDIGNKYLIKTLTNYDDVEKYIRDVQPNLSIEELIKFRYMYYVNGSHYAYIIEDISYIFTLIGKILLKLFPVLIIVILLLSIFVNKNILDKNTRTISIMKLDGFNSNEIIKMYGLIVFINSLLTSLFICGLFKLISYIVSLYYTNKLLIHFNPLYLSYSSIITYVLLTIILSIISILVIVVCYKKMNTIKYLKNN